MQINNVAYNKIVRSTAKIAKNVSKAKTITDRLYYGDMSKSLKEVQSVPFQMRSLVDKLSSTDPFANLL